MILLYKAKVLSFAEYTTAAIYHACDTAIAPLNRLQEIFLAELGLSSEDALLEFNLAPLESRRDIAMLGVIHRCGLGKGPEHFKAFFKFCNYAPQQHQSRKQDAQQAARGHSRPVFPRDRAPERVGINLGIQQITRRHHLWG